MAPWVVTTHLNLHIVLMPAILFHPLYPGSGDRAQQLRVLGVLIRGLRFSNQHPQGNWQQFITPVPGDLMATTGFQPCPLSPSSCFLERESSSNCWLSSPTVLGHRHRCWPAWWSRSGWLVVSWLSGNSSCGWDLNTWPAFCLFALFLFFCLKVGKLCLLKLAL